MERSHNQQWRVSTLQILCLLYICHYLADVDSAILSRTVFSHWRHCLAFVRGPPCPPPPEVCTDDILGNPKARAWGTLSFSRNRINWRYRSPQAAPPFVVIPAPSPGVTHSERSPLGSQESFSPFMAVCRQRRRPVPRLLSGSVPVLCIRLGLPVLSAARLCFRSVSYHL